LPDLDIAECPMGKEGVHTDTQIRARENAPTPHTNMRRCARAHVQAPIGRYVGRGRGAGPGMCNPYGHAYARAHAFRAHVDVLWRACVHATLMRESARRHKA